MRALSLAGAGLGLGAFALALAARAADAPPDTFVARGFQAPAAHERIVLMPGGITDPSLLAAEARVHDELKRRLEAADLQVGDVGESWFQATFRENATAVGGVRDARGEVDAVPFLKASSRVATQACRAADCSLVLRYRLVFRRAHLDGGLSGEFDGVRRSVRMAGGDLSPGALTGGTKAVSVEVVAFLPNGGIAMRTYGGVSIPYIINRASQRFEVDPMIARDPEIGEGVGIALAPVLPH